MAEYDDAEWTAEQRRLAELYPKRHDDTGEYVYSVEDIAGLLDISKQTLHSWRRQMGLPSRKSKYTPSGLGTRVEALESKVDGIDGKLDQVMNLLDELLQQSRDDPEPGNSTEVVDRT